jgi:cation transport regulator
LTVSAAPRAFLEDRTMPYADRRDLPPSLQRRLPPHAQDIYCQAFNHAWATYANRNDREQVCHRVAWAAVKRLYQRIGDIWVPKDVPACDLNGGPR